MNVPQWIEVEVAVAVTPDGSWYARGACDELHSQSQADAVRGASTFESVPIRIYMLKAKLRVPDAKPIKAHVSQPPHSAAPGEGEEPGPHLRADVMDEWWGTR